MLQIAGAGLTSVLSPDAAGAATKSCVVVIDHADAGAPPDIGKIISTDKIGTTIYVRGATREPAWVALSRCDASDVLSHLPRLFNLGRIPGIVGEIVWGTISAKVPGFYPSLG